ncbi:hypothetical protein ES705_00329 [subsurface metagenome]
MSNWRGSLPFGSEEIHPSLGYIKRRQTIEECRKSYLRQLSKNRKEKPIQIFNIFTMNLLLRAMRGEKGADIFREMSKEFKTFKDITENKANDLHVVRTLTRTGLLVHGYEDIDIGTNPGNEKNYIFLRNLIIKLSKKSGYSPAELDRIFWYFARDVCNARPNCDKCPIRNICLTSLGIE